MLYPNLPPYTKPPYYGGAHFPDYRTVYGVHRGSDTLTRSNWRILLKACGFTAERLSTGEIRTNAPNTNYPDADTEPVIVTRAGHALCGWVDILRVREDADPTLLETLDTMIGGLDDYPALDESDWSDLEYTEVCEFWEHMSVSERMSYCQDANISIFAARRAELPEDPAGRLYERLTNL